MKFNREIIPRIIADIIEIDNYDELQNIISDACCEFGFLYSSYIGCSFSTNIQNKVLLSNYPRDWTNLYIKNNLESVDPIIFKTKSSTTPLVWDEQDDFCDSCETFMELAREHRTRSKGIAIPVRGHCGDKGLVSFIGLPEDRRWKSRKSYLIGDLIYLAQNYHCAVARINSSKDFNEIHLTKREKEVLTWASRGKTAWETGQILGLSEKTVAFYVGNTLKKFNSSSKSQVIRICLSLNLI